jgi:hypothetical protein
MVAYIQMVQHVSAWEGVQHHLLVGQNLQKTFDHLMDDDLNADDQASLEVTAFLFVPFTSLLNHPHWNYKANGYNFIFTIKHLHMLIKLVHTEPWLYGNLTDVRLVISLSNGRGLRPVKNYGDATKKKKIIWKIKTKKYLFMKKWRAKRWKEYDSQ